MNDPTFHLVSLGCPKNRVDSERILASMDAAGFIYVPDPTTAHVVIINTCAFIQSAVEESIDTVLDHAADNPDALLVVAGCLPARYTKDLETSLSEAHLFVAPQAMHELPDLIRNALAARGIFKPAPAPAAGVPRILTTQGYAYLKIAEGCMRNCRYCAIPYIRGGLVSASPEDVRKEAEFLAARGVVELILTAQDLTSYGKDTHGSARLPELLQALEDIQGIRWIRLMYLHPQGIPKELPDIINASAKILPYLDVPFQHVSPKVLRAMGRPGKKHGARDLVVKLRKAIPDLTLRTTLMVGFPGEGEADFQELMDFVEECSPEHLGIFPYSPEEAAPAFELGDPIPAAVKRIRMKKLTSSASKLRRKKALSRMGSLQNCIVEGLSQETDLLLQGRLWDQAPEIDGTLYITEGQARVGEIRTVRLTKTHATDYFGELV